MKSKKKIVIVIGIILVICLLVCGYLFKDKIFGNKSDKLKTTWGETYYLYLKDINENKLYDKAGLPSDVKDAKVSIFNVTDIKEPVMTISYNKEDNNYTNVYYIEDDKVNALVYNDLLSGVDFEYIVSSGSLKENIVINQPQDKYEYSFTVDS